MERTDQELPSTTPKVVIMCFATSFCRAGSSAGWFISVSWARMARVAAPAPFTAGAGLLLLLWLSWGVAPAFWWGSAASFSLSGTWKTAVGRNSKVAVMCSALVSLTLASRSVPSCNLNSSIEVHS